MTETKKLETVFELVPITSISKQATAIRLQAWFDEATGFRFEIREVAK